MRLQQILPSSPANILFFREYVGKLQVGDLLSSLSLQLSNLPAFVCGTASPRSANLLIPVASFLSFSTGKCGKLKQVLLSRFFPRRKVPVLVSHESDLALVVKKKAAAGTLICHHSFFFSSSLRHHHHRFIKDGRSDKKGLLRAFFSSLLMCFFSAKSPQSPWLAKEPVLEV